MKKETTKSVAKIEKGLPSAKELSVRLSEETERQKVLDKFIGENLKDGIDYGKIPGCGEKPTLLKPGAEKVISLFNLRPSWARDTEVLEMLGGEKLVALKCELINRVSNEIVGEGRGVARPAEKSSWNENTQVKICEKRALVDAVLSTFALSSRYTQDVEDMGTKAQEQPQKATQGNTASHSASEVKLISDKQAKFIRSLLKDANKNEEWVMAKTGRAGAKLETMPLTVGTQVIDQLVAMKDKNKPAEKKEDLKIVCQGCNTAVDEKDYMESQGLCMDCMKEKAGAGLGADANQNNQEQIL